MNIPQAYDVESFCKKFNISKSMFYKLKRQGRAPRIMKIGKRTIISIEAVTEWQAQMEETV